MIFINILYITSYIQVNLIFIFCIMFFVKLSMFSYVLDCCVQHFYASMVCARKPAIAEVVLMSVFLILFNKLIPENDVHLLNAT